VSESKNVQTVQAPACDGERLKKKSQKNPADRGIEEFPKDSGRYRAVYFYKGQKKREMVGSKSLARKVRQKRLTEIAENRFFPESQRQKETLLSEMIDDMIQRAEGRIIAMKDYKRYGRYWKEAFSGRTLNQITTGDIERYQAQRRKAVSPATVNREVKFLKRVFNVAMKDKLVTENPTDGVTLYKENNERTRFLKCEEEIRLKDEIHPDYWPLVLFAINTGLRQAEQFKLRWENVSFTTGLITIPRSKNGKLRRVPMNETVRSILRELPSRGRSDLVFPSKAIEHKNGTHAGKVVGGETPLDARNFVHRVFQPALKRAEITDLHWHDLRHTFASRLVMKGVDIRTVQVLMGHASITMTMRYAHLSPSHELDAVRSLDAVPSDTKTDTSETRAEAAV
jgi:site-specific recombinase XerD